MLAGSLPMKRGGVWHLTLTPQTLGLFTTSQTQTASHKMEALFAVFLQLLNPDLEQTRSCVCFHIIPYVNCFGRCSTCVQNIVIC